MLKNCPFLVGLPIKMMILDSHVSLPKAKLQTFFSIFCSAEHEKKCGVLPTPWRPSHFPTMESVGNDSPIIQSIGCWLVVYRPTIGWLKNCKNNG